MIGRTLSNFRVTAKLGEGGMGEVYRAEDTKLGRDVAIKVLPETVASDPDRLARFEREAKVLASLNHPNIAAIYSLESSEAVEQWSSEENREGTSPSPTSAAVHFLVMELAEGETLSSRIAAGPIPIAEALSIAVQVAEALEAAHAKEIIHRDLKPGNVMVTPEGKVKVLDFGLARRQTSVADLGQEAPTATMDELTREDQIVGTIPYMSPEQLRARPLDPRSDLFSFGVMAFEMLAKQRPFAGETSVDLISSILKEPTPNLAALRPDMPDVLNKLIEDCLEKQPDQRPASASALRQRLVEAVEAVEARRAKQESAADSGTELDRRVVAVLPFDNLSGAEEAEFLATGLHNDLLTDLSRIEGLTIISRSSVMQVRQTEKTVRQIGHQLNAGTIIEGTVQSAGNRVRLTAQLIDAAQDVQRWAERYDRELSTETLFDLQSEVARRIVDSLQSELAPALEIPRGKVQTHDMEAYRLVTLGRVQVERRTESGCRRAIEHFQSAVERDPDYAPAWAGLAEALAISVWYAYLEPGDRLQQAERAALRAVELDPDSAEAHGSLAMSLGATRDGTGAMQELAVAVQLQPSYWEAHSLASYLHLLHGRARESLEGARRAVEINPLSAEAVSHLALSLLTTGDPQGALPEIRRAAELSPGWTTATFYEALCLYELGDFRESAALLTDLTVEWTGLGAQATLALTQLAGGNESTARQMLATMDPGIDAFAVGLVHLALGETDAAFERFLEAEELNDWACLAIHHLYHHIWTVVKEDPRYRGLVRRAYASHNIEPSEGETSD